MQRPHLLATLLLAASTLTAQTLTPMAEDRQRARDIFRELVGIDTTHEHGSVTKAAEAMRARFLAAGFSEQDMHLEGPNELRKNLVVRYRGQQGSTLKPVLVICHLDVVEALRSDWTTDPFTLVEKDGYFQGRGTQDMKSDDAAVVAALLRMKKENFSPARDIVVALTADEESGGDNGVKWLIANHRDWIDAAFVINPDTGGVTGEKGKAVSVSVGATEKLYYDFTFKATNRGGHSSVPRADNAIYQLAHALERLEAFAFPVELNEVTRKSLQERAERGEPEIAPAIRALLADPHNASAATVLSKNANLNATIRTTCVATQLHGGHAENALPQTAEANINCRILPGHSAREVREQLTRVVNDPGIDIRFGDLSGQSPSHSPDDKALPPPPLDPIVFGALRRTVDQFYPGIPIQPHMGTGATDSIYTMAAGIPSYGISGFMIDEGRAHGRDERLRIEAFDTGAEFLYRYLVEVSK